MDAQLRQEKCTVFDVFICDDSDSDTLGTSADESDNGDGEEGVGAPTVQFFP